MRILITGGLGFIGGWLTPHLAAQGHEVWLTYHRVPPLGELRVEGAAGTLGVDVRDPAAMESCLREVQPDRIYHLAAQSFPTVSWKKPAETLEVNAIGTSNLLEAHRKLELDARIFVACSSAEYGIVRPEDVPTKEDHPLRPLHPYGVSKVAQDLLAYQEHKNHGTHTVRLRIFNTTGPGKTNDVAADYTQRAVEIELGRREPVFPVGNLEPKRSFCDVRDMVRAFEASLEKGQPGEVYNAGAAEAVPVRHLLDEVLALCRAKPEVRVDQALLRPTDEPIIFGDTSKLREQTGWRPAIPLKQTLSDMMDHWRRVLAAE